jgi:acyl-CoA thioester hydrolase
MASGSSEAEEKAHAEPQDLTFSWPVRVYYEDTDAAGIVYHANFLRFLERARTELLRVLGFEHANLARDHGVVFIVRSLQIQYKKPALLNDLLTVTVQIARLGRSLVVFEQRIRRNQDLLAQATVEVPCVTYTGLRPVALPSSLRAALEGLP